MAYTYFGGADQQSPIVPPSSVTWDTINPPEVRAEAWAFENARREAERQRELEAQLMGRPQDTADTVKAIEAATRLQGMRGYQRDAATMGQAAALQKHAPAMFFGLAGGPRAMTGLQAKPEAAMIEQGGERFIRQPSGSLVHVPNRSQASTRDTQETMMQGEIAKAQTALNAAQRAKAGVSATREEIIPASQPGPIRRFFGAVPTPAITNQVPFAPPEDIAKAAAVEEEARRQKSAAQETLQNYLLQKRGPATNAPAAAPAAAPSPAGTGASGYIPGRRYGNLRYKGGDPTDENNWEKVN